MDKQHAHQEPGEKTTRRALIGHVFLASTLLLIALNLRPFFPSLPVLLPDIVNALGLGGFQAGSLTTLPVLCLGLFAPLAPWLAQKIGMEKNLLLLVGAVYDISGSHTVASTVFIFTGLAAAVFGFLAGRPLFARPSCGDDAKLL